jgi:hypothetical protein
MMVEAGRLYAMEKGLEIPAKERMSETKAILISLMNQLEKVSLLCHWHILNNRKSAMR